MKKQLALLAAALVTVLVLAAQLAHANAGPEPDDPQDSLPAWSSDAVHLAFQRTSPDVSHPLQMTSAGRELYVDYFTGELRGWVPGTQKKLIQTGNETLVVAAARELPQVSLDDALRICLVLRGGDPVRYERAAVRWLGRFALEGRGVTIGDLRHAAQALDELPTRAAEAMERLQRLCVARGVA